MTFQIRFVYCAVCCALICDLVLQNKLCDYVDELFIFYFFFSLIKYVCRKMLYKIFKATLLLTFCAITIVVSNYSRRTTVYLLYWFDVLFLCHSDEEKKHSKTVF